MFKYWLTSQDKCIFLLLFFKNKLIIQLQSTGNKLFSYIDNLNESCQFLVSFRLIFQERRLSCNPLCLLIIPPQAPAMLPILPRLLPSHWFVFTSHHCLQSSDASICFNLLQSASICFNLLQSASICFNLLQSASICFNLLQSASICFNLLQSASICFNLLQSASICFNLLQSASICFNLLQSASICFNLLQSASICFNLLQSASICFNLLQSASICFNLLQSASICFNLLQSASICFNLLQSASSTNVHFDHSLTTVAILEILLLIFNFLPVFVIFHIKYLLPTMFSCGETGFYHLQPNSV